jgi:diguanylate cyclase (GGDEF)-like protein/PAS domain S-box-containing protein
MMPLHIPTMFVVVMIATAAAGGALALIARRGQRELAVWSWALLTQVCAYLLLALRGTAPDFVSIVVANAMVSVSISLYAVGIHRFDRRPVPWAILFAPAGIIVVGFTLLLGDFFGRMLLGGLVLLAQSLHLLALLMARRRRTVGRGQYLLIVAAAFYVVAMLYRLIAVSTGLDTAAGLTDPTPLAVFNFLSSLICTVLLSVGVLAMVFERAHRDAIDSEQRYRRLIEAANEGIMILEGGRIRMVNPKLCALMGYAEAELLERPFLDLVHPDDREAVSQRHRERLEGASDGITYIGRGLTRSQGERWFRVSGVLIDWHGRPASLNFLSDVTEQRETERRIRELAFHDPLTGLPNRRLFLDRLRQALAACTRSGRRLAVVFLDLDNFKSLNDRQGHAAGDQLLAEFARRLACQLRESDTAARFGGDEFMLLLTELGPSRGEARAQARQVLEKLMSALSEPYDLDVLRSGQAQAVVHRCELSAGVAIGPLEPAPATGSQAEPDVLAAAADALVERADAAMYEAKKAGRNRMMFDGEAGGEPEPATVRAHPSAADRPAA